ncbi:1-(5-phosphoribosyl)-5-amino-4-imidazole-carboxylate carboxylase [Desulfuribacillus stibiiarsenatis]|uniref:1-(5-phosphoribosyl)-5-amino-4-imidazole-carboxylate carboxylase n=1 Tax=Desulfuribacillus stibiiarsenatis TaxID=1390249 RepID=A0A1E5L8Y8_9FIRM|nr:nickel pincer cofactor biosynthesis protein LarB [Desulfuribacillus stibiiarsenatis]OEH86494.1 1-(5-phosphoribosyl)-5-amino-4-imidazole-carboxylate carboxylase [Desulfuribacillus stibiiarsenatis]
MSTIKSILAKVQSGSISIDDASQLLTFENLGFAKVDHNRAERNGFPEVIFSMGKTPEQVASIMNTIYKHSPIVLATRATQEHYKAVQELNPEAMYHAIAGCITLGSPSTALRPYKVSIVAAGTSDIPVAEEAVVTLDAIGITTERVYDVGVAGIHRLFAHIESLRQAQVVIVIAGMEGALPSVVGGLVSCPVIAVPTSVGYGAHFQGLAPLLTMLNSCASGITVVNIDNGFGAAIAAGNICKAIHNFTD